MQSPMDLVKKSKYHMYLIEGPILYTAIFSRLIGRYCFGYLRKAIQLLI